MDGEPQPQALNIPTLHVDGEPDRFGDPALPSQFARFGDPPQKGGGGGGGGVDAPSFAYGYSEYASPTQAAITAGMNGHRPPAIMEEDGREDGADQRSRMQSLGQWPAFKLVETETQNYTPKLVSTTPGITDDQKAERLNILRSYIPRIVYQRYEEDPSMPSEPQMDSFYAAVLFADVSGFTALTESLVKGGGGEEDGQGANGNAEAAGAEQLTRHLNKYFGRMIEIIQENGGDIIKFAGDAMLVVWPGGEKQMQMMVRRAVRASLLMQEELHDYPATETVNLSLHMGIGAGQLYGLHVGGQHNRWEFLASGEPIVQIGMAEASAASGEIVLSSEAWEIVHHHCTGKELDNGCVLLEDMPKILHGVALPKFTITPELEPALSSYIPGAIRSRVVSGHAEDWEGEFRRVTVLFVNLTGLDCNAPDLLGTLHRAMVTIQKVLYHYEGSINKFLMDDKGTTMIAVFGLPPLAHEDDAIRGVQAALTLHSKLKENVMINSSVGVTSKSVFCGSVGSELRREYTVMGDAVNLAARLMQHAAGSILCDKHTQKAASERIVFDELEAIMVKGKSRPVQIFRPKEVNRRSNAESKSMRFRSIKPRSRSTVHQPVLHHQFPLVGRSHERALITQAIYGLESAGKKAILIIEGELGMGKSRLMEEVKELSEAVKLEFLQTTAVPSERNTALYPWRSIFHQLFPTEESRPEDFYNAVKDIFRGAPHYENLLPLLRVFALVAGQGTEEAEAEICKMMSSQQRKENVLKLLIRVLQSFQQKLIIVMEDIQCMDSLSWNLLLAVCKHVDGILVIVTTRHDHKSHEREYSALLSMQGVHRLQLQPLSSEEISDLVKGRLGVKKLPQSVESIVCQKAQGNPLFSEELALSLLESQFISVQTGECYVLKNLTEVSLPDTVQGVVTSRVDGLTPSEQLTAKIASVFATSFDAQVLKEVYPGSIEDAQLQKDLDKLEEMDIVMEDHIHEGGRITYSFKQHITQEVVYGMMLFTQRAQLHKAVALYMERVYDDDLRPYWNDLASHWLRAQDPSKAVKYCRMAGEQALTSFANVEAISLLEQILVILREQPLPEVTRAQRAAIERQIAEAYDNMGEFAKSKDHLEKALEILRKPVPATKRGLATSISSLMVKQAVPCTFRKGAKKSDAKEQKMEIVRANLKMALVYYYASKKSAFLHCIMRARATAEKLGEETEELAETYALSALAMGVVPLHDRAKTYVRLAMETSENIASTSLIANVQINICTYHTGVCNWKLAKHHLLGAAHNMARLGDRRRWEQASTKIGSMYLFQGEYREAATVFNDLLEEARSRDDKQALVWGLNGQAKAQLMLGNLVECIKYLEEAGRDNMQDSSKLTMNGTQAIVLYRTGDRHGALDFANKALQTVVDHSPISVYTLDGYYYLADTLLHLWEDETREEEIEEAKFKDKLGPCLDIIHKFARVFPVAIPRHHILKGRWYKLTGNPEKAKKHLKIALSEAIRLSMPYEEARARYLLVRNFTEEGSVKILRLAHESFEELGTVWEAKRVKVFIDYLEKGGADSGEPPPHSAEAVMKQRQSRLMSTAAAGPGVGGGLGGGLRRQSTVVK